MEGVEGAIVVPVGSRATCSPPPTDTDEDYLVLVKDRQAAVAALKAIGFEYSADPEVVARYEIMGETSGWAFTSLFFGEINYIVTESKFFFERFLTATYICKRLNLLDKEDRIAVFEAIRGASFAKQVCPEWRDEMITENTEEASHERRSMMMGNLINMLPQTF